MASLNLSLNVTLKLVKQLYMFIYNIFRAFRVIYFHYDIFGVFSRKICH